MDTRILLLATLLALGGLALAPVASADVIVPVYACDLDGHCACWEITIEAKLHVHRRCAF